MKLSTYKAVPFVLITLLISSVCAQGLMAGTVVCTSAGSVTIEPGFNGFCVADCAAKKETTFSDEIVSWIALTPCQDIPLFQGQGHWNADSEKNSTHSMVSVWSDYLMDVSASPFFFSSVLKLNNIINHNITCLKTIRLII